ncbi:hypothetical protein [Halobacterium yunchengense]|uniref:hypothetical protein n=1 Tax=Halobacterium yunchengense TaxID=3108497 RepID=UPI0030082504
MERAYVTRAVGLVAASTVLLTAAFVGVVALADGAAADVGDRLPFYLFAGAVLFVATIVTLEDPEAGGVPILTSTVAVSVVGTALFALAGEGVLYAGRNPGDVLGSSLVVYFVSAALVCTGSVYWALNHWREFTS